MRRADAPSGRQALAPARAPRRDEFAAAHGAHARTETMPALANDLARLQGPVHGSELRSQVSPDVPPKPGAFAAPRRLAAYMGGPPRSQCNPGNSAGWTRIWPHVGA